VSIHVQHDPPSRPVRGICELTLETTDLARLERFYRSAFALDIACHRPVEHPGGDRSLYVDDPDGNVVEVWDFFEHGEGARDGVRALA
jgi:catechol 2,3-dioxygenase-like lactoylglutathione lyase family enzyme